ncbi:hypothetical protein HBJ58_10175 [Halomonas desiderata]|uniref:hypothetical protein n=1 Tax=Billgrantia desiderata TaxID=52021 RepID=UPI00174D3EEA|nr:hypothetical protein [Halomonas desiderata]
MKLDNRELYDLLSKEKGVDALYHANTVATSVTFIENGGLISRGGVVVRGLYQTPQSSDGVDMVFDVWDDVFLDVVDLHGFFPRQNIYGPVLFKFNLSLLLEDEVDVWVTKDNPIYWNDKAPSEEKYFQSVQELRETWDNYELQKKMVTIRKPQNPILFEFLTEIVIDNPMISLRNGTVLFDAAERSISSAVADNLKAEVLIKSRRCGFGCFCKSNYSGFDDEKLSRLFLPRRT